MQIPQKWLIALLLTITVASTGVATWAILFRETTVEISPDYPPQQTEENAEPIPGGEQGKLEAPTGGGSVSLSYRNQVSVNLQTGVVELKFANPHESTQNVILQIVIQDTVIVQSGKILPGNQVNRLELLPGTADLLCAGGYDGDFVVSYYDPATEEKAMVNTVIPIAVTVNE